MVKYTLELLNDVEELRKDFCWFMTMNLVHMDKGLPPDCAAKMSELIAYSRVQATAFVDLFEIPLKNHEAKNKDKLLKNYTRLMEFFYEYLLYAERILKRCKPDVYTDRFTKVKEHYAKFFNKYPK